MAWGSDADRRGNRLLCRGMLRSRIDSYLHTERPDILLHLTAVPKNVIKPSAGGGVHIGIMACRHAMQEPLGRAIGCKGRSKNRKRPKVTRCFDC